jgi:hypothetical protein
VTTDASTGTELATGGMGAVLLQERKDKTERLVVYASRGLKDHKKYYPAFLLEKAAACWGIDYFETYLTPPKQFTLCTDHRLLKTMSTVHNKTHNNLQLLMLKFNFVIKYKEGWRNTVADALSRTHAGVPICVVTRSGRRTAEDNSVSAYRRAEEEEEEEQDSANKDDSEIPSRAIVARLPLTTPHRDLVSTIGVNLQKEQDKDKRTKMVKEYLTNSVLPRDRAKADWVVTMSNHCLLVDNVLWYKTKTKTRITMAVWAPLALRQLVMEAAHALRDGGRSRVARLRPLRRNNDDRQSQTRILQARNDVGHKCVCTQVPTLPEGEGQAPGKGGAPVHAHQQQPKQKIAHQLVQTTVDLSSRKS